MLLKQKAQKNYHDKKKYTLPWHDHNSQHNDPTASLAGKKPTSSA